MMVRSWPRLISTGSLALFLSVARQTSSSSEYEYPGSDRKRRAVQSDAVCIDQFDWMDNSMHQSPCIVAAYLLAACAGGSWDVYEVTPDTHYTPPNATNANGCHCSWAVYNTLQACADCQGQNYEGAMISWSGYNGNCTGSLLSDTDYYPEDTPVPDETAIPLWATTNPSDWPNGLFDPSMAQSIANQGNSDITQSNRPSTSTSSTASGSGKKANKGAITAAVVVSGIIIILLFLIFLYRCTRLRRHRRHAHHNIDKISRTKSKGRYNNNAPSVRFSPLAHIRSDSDTSVVLPGRGYSAHSTSKCKYRDGPYTLTSSPGLTPPVSIMTTGRPPLNTLPSSSSDNTIQPGKYNDSNGSSRSSSNNNNNASNGGMAMVTMTMNDRPSQAAMSVSSAYATAPSVSSITPSNHAHKLSNGRVGAGMVDGYIYPYILPPALPEPMASEEGRAGASSRGGHGHGHRHGRETSDSSAQLTQERHTSTIAISTGRRPPMGRLNPPAYATLSPLYPPGIFGPPTEGGAGIGADAVEDEGVGEDGMSETTLCGTTLDGQASGANAQADRKRT